MFALAVIMSDLFILLLYYLFAAHYKFKIAFKKEHRDISRVQSAVFALSILLSPILVTKKWDKSGEMKNQMKIRNCSRKQIIFMMMKSTYYYIGAMLDYVAKRLAEEPEKYDRIVCAAKSRQRFYSAYFEKQCFEY